MCPVCWISGFIAALFGGSFIAVANHPISWILSIILISYAGYKFYEAKKRGKKMSEETKDRNKKTKLKTDSEFVEKLLEKANVAAVQGSAFGLPGYFRISYATSMQKLKIAMERIKSFCNNLD